MYTKNNLGAKEKYWAKPIKRKWVNETKIMWMQTVK